MRKIFATLVVAAALLSGAGCVSAEARSTAERLRSALGKAAAASVPHPDLAATEKGRESYARLWRECRGAANDLVVAEGGAAVGEIIK